MPTLFIKRVCFVYLSHGISIQVPFIPQISNIFGMHDSKACQIFHSGHLWNRGSWHCHMCSHVTPCIALCRPFHILRELPCCFVFKLCLYVSSMKTITDKSQENSTTNRAYSVKISGCIVPLIYFWSLDIIVMRRSIMLSVSTTAVKSINSSARIALRCHFFRVSWICTPCATICSKLILQATCDFSRPE